MRLLWKNPNRRAASYKEEFLLKQELQRGPEPFDKGLRVPRTQSPGAAFSVHSDLRGTVLPRGGAVKMPHATARKLWGLPPQQGGAQHPTELRCGRPSRALEPPRGARTRGDPRHNSPLRPATLSVPGSSFRTRPRPKRHPKRETKVPATRSGGERFLRRQQEVTWHLFRSAGLWMAVGGGLPRHICFLIIFSFPHPSGPHWRRVLLRPRLPEGASGSRLGLGGKARRPRRPHALAPSLPGRAPATR